MLGEARLPSSSNEYELLNTFKFIKAVSGTLLGMINATYNDKPLMFIFVREKLISHHQAVLQIAANLPIRRFRLQDLHI